MALLGLCSAGQVRLTCVQGCCAGGCYVTLLVGQLCGGFRCSICVWCQSIVVWVDCSCSLFRCVSALSTIIPESCGGKHVATQRKSTARPQDVTAARSARFQVSPSQKVSVRLLPVSFTLFGVECYQ